MSSAVPVLAVVACPVGMAAMMWTMMRGRGGTDSPQARELAALHAEIAQLKAQRPTM